MSSSTLAWGNLEKYTTNSTEVSTGTAEPTYFQFVFHRNDIDTVGHEGYVDGRRYFSTVHVRDSTSSNVRYLFENNESEIYDAIVETAKKPSCCIRWSALNGDSSDSGS